jgi:serine/threonine-protein phosphatase PGAM5
MAKRWVYLVRHGQEDRENRDGEWGGSLTEFGRKQAALTATYLKQIPFTSLHASTLHRARETAERIAAEFPHLDLQLTDLLWETVPSIPPHLADLPYFRDVSAEKITEEQVRMAEVFDTYLRLADGESDEYDLVVCHGNLIRTVVSRILHMPEHAWIHGDTFNGSITRVRIEAERGPILETYCEVAHFPPDLITYI